MSLEGKKIAILLAPRGTEEPEFVQPKDAVEKAGATVVVVGLKAGEAQAVNNDLDPGATYVVDKAIGEVSAAEFDGLVIPGGSVGADKLRGDEKVVVLSTISSCRKSRLRSSVTGHGSSSRQTSSTAGR